MTSGYNYVGNELDVFAAARRWKAYWLEQASPYLRGDLLEVGAGLGTNTPLLSGLEAVSAITCLEPDANLLARLRETLGTRGLLGRCAAVGGTTASLGPDRSFDSIVYIDVLEHIEDDEGEMRRAAGLLRLGGHLVVLSPAHAWLYSEFDRAIGHCRRYSLRGLLRLAPQGLSVRVFRYLDSAGLLASCGYKAFSKRLIPTLFQVRCWDSGMVPISRWLDPLLAYRLGKSVLGIWQKV